MFITARDARFTDPGVVAGGFDVTRIALHEIEWRNGQLDIVLIEDLGGGIAHVGNAKFSAEVRRDSFVILRENVT